MEKESGLGLNDAIDLASKGQKQIGVYPCPFAGCSLEYKTRSALIRHLRTHTGMPASYLHSYITLLDYCSTRKADITHGHALFLTHYCVANNAPIQLQTRSKSDLHKPKKRPRRASAAEAPLDGLFGSGVGTRSSRSKKAKRGASTAFGAGGPGRGRESKRAGNAETSGNVEGDDGESGDKSRVGGSDVDESENSSGRDVPSPAVIASHAEYFAKQLCAARVRLTFMPCSVASFLGICVYCSWLSVLLMWRYFWSFCSFLACICVPACSGSLEKLTHGN